MYKFNNNIRCIEIAMADDFFKSVYRLITT